jgi:uncharacterized membrane protein
MPGSAAIHHTHSILTWWRAHRSYWLAVDLLFGLALVGWAIYKAYNPNLETAGGEKWMEIAFVNGVLRSGSFPPQDPWLSGFGISYYYFGYVLMAMVTRLSGLLPTVAYNLFVPSLFALTLTGAFSLVYNLVLARQSSSAEPDSGIPAFKVHRAPSHTRPESRPQSGATDQGAGIRYGLVGAALVGIVGNLEGVLEVLFSRGLLPAGFWRWLDILDINQAPVSGGWLPSRFIWWWRASRVIHDCSFQGLLTGNCNPPAGNWEVIDEFPFFSFLLGDVHPHVLALPFVLLVLGLALNLVLRKPGAGERVELRRAATETADLANGPAAAANRQEQEATDRAALASQLRTRISGLVAAVFGHWLLFGVTAICLGVLGFLNTWDFPIYLLVIALALAVARWRAGSTGWLVETVGLAAALGALGGAFYAPFYLSFQSQAGGILPNLFNPTRLPQFLVFFGPFLVIIAGYLMVLSRTTPLPGWRRRLPFILVLTLGAPVLAMMLMAGLAVLSPATRGWAEGLLNTPELQSLLGGRGTGSLGSLIGLALRLRVGSPWTFLLLGALLAWVVLCLWSARSPSDRDRPGLAPATAGVAARHNLAPGDAFALILIGVGILLPLAVEFVYLRDQFGTRMNTVFKFYFQAWVLLGMAAAYGACVVGHSLRGKSGGLWRLGVGMLVAGGLVYPVLAIPNKTDNFNGSPTLDGMAWLQSAHPDDYLAIRWLQANAPDSAVILEAPGDHHAAYQYVGRVSALTGLPTLLGWGDHENQWRGNYDEPARREPDIDLLYNGLDTQQTLTLLDKYRIKYVYVGSLERQRYQPAGLAKFEELMQVAYRHGEVTIYQR